MQIATTRNLQKIVLFTVTHVETGYNKGNGIEKIKMHQRKSRGKFLL